MQLQFAMGQWRVAEFYGTTKTRIVIRQTELNGSTDHSSPDNWTEWRQFNSLINLYFELRSELVFSPASRDCSAANTVPAISAMTHGIGPPGCLK